MNNTTIKRFRPLITQNEKLGNTELEKMDCEDYESYKERRRNFLCAFHASCNKKQAQFLLVHHITVYKSEFRYLYSSSLIPDRSFILINNRFSN